MKGTVWVLASLKFAFNKNYLHDFILSWQEMFYSYDTIVFKQHFTSILYSYLEERCEVGDGATRDLLANLQARLTF